MRTAELARLAGVTVRTVRHYHQIGILAEPRRQENGHRSYDMHDLIRVLRIKNLGAAGIPLVETAGILDGQDSTDDIDAMLAALDHEFAQKIERLTAQRELIAAARAARTAPDFPPQLGRIAALLGADPSELSESTRGQVVLLGQVMGAADRTRMMAFFEELDDPRILPRLLAVNQRFEELSATSDEDTITALVDGFAAVLASLAEPLDSLADTILLDGTAQALLDAYRRKMLNAAQQTVLARLAGDEDPGATR
ncbi:MerR family transcriptional regulator [Nocardiopsis ansamitocini]|uniref:MerR family transcriptional regulator n=1 Tax=Nocardiopsis ansamitocini TaxID=1670832 RepID=A0A9W6P9C7_9ACTN|nr:MerR family transcriptional regulator [Nocardiopsis ansamitocini]GLU50009.1 MerR family transcriptional regulator [Nocardiopsis ansamitocini]